MTRIPRKNLYTNQRLKGVEQLQLSLIPKAMSKTLKTIIRIILKNLAMMTKLTMELMRKLRVLKEERM